VVHTALQQAVRWGLIVRNPASLARPPRKQHTEPTALTVEQARALLRAAAGHRLEAMFELALKTGMRQGELLALRWVDVDLDQGVVQIRASLRRTAAGLTIGAPKTSRSRRKVVLSAGTVEALRRHRDRQDTERANAVRVWHELGLVFPNTVGRPIEAQNLLQREFRPLLERAGLPPITFHALRHTAASLLLVRGEHPKVVQELLGHSDVGVTMNRYSHLVPTLMSQAASKMDGLLDA
jgi:integrase